MSTTDYTNIPHVVWFDARLYGATVDNEVDKVGCAAAVICTGNVVVLVDIACCITIANALDKSLTSKVAITL